MKRILTLLLMLLPTWSPAAPPAAQTLYVYRDTAMWPDPQMWTAAGTGYPKNRWVLVTWYRSSGSVVATGPCHTGLAGTLNKAMKIREAGTFKITVEGPTKVNALPGGAPVIATVAYTIL